MEEPLALNLLLLAPTADSPDVKRAKGLARDAIGARGARWRASARRPFGPSAPTRQCEQKEAVYSQRKHVDSEPKRLGTDGRQRPDVARARGEPGHRVPDRRRAGPSASTGRRPQDVHRSVPATAPQRRRNGGTTAPNGEPLPGSPIGVRGVWDVCVWRTLCVSTVCGIARARGEPGLAHRRPPGGGCKTRNRLPLPANSRRAGPRLSASAGSSLHGCTSRACWLVAAGREASAPRERGCGPPPMARHPPAITEAVHASNTTLGARGFAGMGPSQRRRRDPRWRQQQQRHIGMSWPVL